MSAKERLAAVLTSLASIPPPELQACLTLFNPLTLDAGQFFVVAGDLPQTIAFLDAGLMRLFYTTPDGAEATKAFCLPPEFVGAYRALLLGEPCQFSIQALHPSTLLVASYAQFQALTDGHPCWARLLQRIAEILFTKKEQRESELLLDDAATRYERFLAQYPGLEEHVKQYHIASYLGITPVSLSRIRRQRRRD